MKSVFLILLLLPLSFPAMGAKNKNFRYKVESKENEKKTKTHNPYPYDSVEKSAPSKKFAKTMMWSLRPKLSLSTGFHVDKAVLEDDKTNRFFFSAALRFHNRPAHRIAVNTQIMQNNSMFLGAAWELTPSRERARSYYGIGLAHLLVSEKEFSNLVEWDNYHLTAHYGYEVLLQNDRAWSVEIKGFLASGGNYAAQLSGGYIVSF